MLSHVVLDSRPLGGERRFGISATAGRPYKLIVTFHSITDYRERP